MHNLISINIKKIFNFKLFLLVSIIFICISKLGVDSLKYTNYKSKFDVVLYAFGAFNSSYNLTDNLNTIIIYFVLFYIIIKFIAMQLDKDHYIFIMKSKSLSIYIINMLISIFIIILVYFLWGYIIALLSLNSFNYDFFNGYFLNYFNSDSNYIRLLLNSFLINILVSYSISLLMLILSILVVNERVSFLILFLMFNIGNSSKFKYIPGFHVILSKININLNCAYFILSQCYMYVAITILSIVMILYISIYRKELIYNYIEN